MISIRDSDDCRHCRNLRGQIPLYMLIIIAVLLLVFLPGGLLLAPVTIELDTRKSWVQVEWMGLLRWRWAYYMRSTSIRSHRAGGSISILPETIICCCDSPTGHGGCLPPGSGDSNILFNFKSYDHGIQF